MSIEDAEGPEARSSSRRSPRGAAVRSRLDDLNSALEALSASEARLAGIVETALEGIVTIDEKGTIASFNPAAERMFGYGAQEVLGKNVGILMPSPHDRQHDGYLARYLQTGEKKFIGSGREVIGLRKNGTTFPVEIGLTELLLGGGREFTGVLRDVTERKCREKLVAAQYDVTRALANSAAIGRAAPEVLQSICEGVGWELGELWRVDRVARAMRLEGTYQGTTVEAKELETAGRQDVFPPGEGLPGRVWDENRPVWVTDVTRDQGLGSASALARAGLRSAAAFPVCYGNKVTGALVFFGRQVTPPDDDLLGMMVALGKQIGDFFERKNVESELLQAQKMEAVGRLAGGIAHDFNNLLMGVLGYCRITTSAVDKEDAAREALKEIAAAAEGGVGLTRRLLAFTRKCAPRPEVIDLGEAATASQGMLRQLLGEDISLTVVLETSRSSVVADRGEVEQILMNLAVNARDAMPAGGELTVKVSHAEASCCESWPHGDTPGGLVTLTVRDTGCGMSAETRLRACEPFFTTKAEGEGTGLGLSTAYAIARQYGGHLSIQSTLGSGTTVRVCFPLVNASTSRRGVGPRDEVTRGGSETVLVVEDHPLVRATVRHDLGQLGYTVLEAEGAEEALRVSDGHAGSVDVLLTDVVLPRVSGPELAVRVIERYPGVRVVYMSAHSGEDLVKQGRIEAGVPCLEKPFTEAKLAATVRAALAPARP